MKGLYYCRINKDNAQHLGVIKKCQSQAFAFRNTEIELDLLWYSNQGILLNDQLLRKSRFNWLKHPVFSYFFYLFIEIPQLIRLINFKEYDFLYLRFVALHPYFLFFLKHVHKQNPQMKIFLEVPTYPYDDEFQGFLPKLALGLDILLRKRLRRYIHRVVHYGEEKHIFGIPTIPIKNGVNLEQIPVSNSTPINNRLRMIAIGNWNIWHGLDRLLKGMDIYYRTSKTVKTNVHLTIIGHGKEYPNYKEFIQNHQLEPYVKCLPPQSDKQLDRYFEEADLGIGTLGIHRIKVPFNSALKHRYYCGRGLPFILSSMDKDFPDTLQFIYYIPRDEAPININELVTFFEKLVKQNEEFHHEIRQYAEYNLSWRAQMKPVFEELKTL